MRRVHEIHLTPDDEDGPEHFTRSCWCEPVYIEISLGLFRHEVIYFHREQESDAVSDEDVRDLETTIDGLSEENGELERKNGELVEAVRDALSDLETIDDVPFGKVVGYVEAVVRELRKVIEP